MQIIPLNPSDNSSEFELSLLSIIKKDIEGSFFATAIDRTKALERDYFQNIFPPWIAPRINISDEMRSSSELYLPIAKVRGIFRNVIRHIAVNRFDYSDTIFAKSCSYADIAALLPLWLEDFYTPSKLIKNIEKDYAFRCRFLFWLFMPDRYYGVSSDRYDNQRWSVVEILKNRKDKEIRWLDAASGDGLYLYSLFNTLLNAGFEAKQLYFEGWCYNHFELFSSIFGYAFNSSIKNSLYFELRKPIFDNRYERRIAFKINNLLSDITVDSGFDIITCNGLIGGPIINKKDDIEKIIEFFASILKKDGILLMDNHFHDGWKKVMPTTEIMKIAQNAGLKIIPIMSGVAGLRLSCS